MLIRFLAAAMVAATIPQLVLAQPAIIRVFEAFARAAPDDEAPMVHVFQESAEVSVAEAGENGWRRVRVPDGSTAWIRENALSFRVVAAEAGPIPPSHSDNRAPVVAAASDHLVGVVLRDTSLRSAPDKAARRLHIVSRGTEVEAEKRASRGFRRVKASEGRSGFALDTDLQLRFTQGVAAELKPSPVPDTLLTSEVARAELRPRIYVKDIAHLAELTQRDAQVGEFARSLERRRNGAMAVGIVGVTVSLVLIVAGAVKADNYYYDRSLDPFSEPAGSDGTGLLLGGLVLAIVSPLVSYAMAPKRNDLLDVINNWNTRHPDEQFELGFGHLQRN